MENDDNVEPAQSSSVRVAHSRQQNAAVVPEKPAAPARRSAGASVATRGATIASCFVRPQTTPAAPAPQVPAAALDKPAAATRARRQPLVSAVPAQLVAPQAPASAAPTPPPAAAVAAAAAAAAAAPGQLNAAAAAPPRCHPPAAGLVLPRVPNTIDCTPTTPPPFQPSVVDVAKKSIMLRGTIVNRTQYCW